MLIVAFLISIIAATVRGGRNSFCPAICSCNDQTLTVSCEDGSLKEAPNTLNPSLQRLILKRNKIQSIYSASFKFYDQLIFIDLSDNQLLRIPNEAFASQGKLIELHLNRNKISSVLNRTFVGLKSLTALNLRSNFLEELPDRLFSSLTSLKELDLGQNRISKIEPSTFAGLSSLRVLILDDNQLRKVPSSSFQFLSNLAELRLGLNAFNVLTNDSFKGLNELTILDLSGTGLVHIEEFAFRGLNALRTLTLTDNQLTLVPTKQLSYLPRLEDLSIGKNDFKIISKDAFEGCQYLKRLEISGTPKLEKIEKEAFRSNLNLETLILTSNKELTTIEEGALTGLPTLKQLVLRDNAFASFKESLVAWPELARMDLWGNPVNCDCSLLWLRDLLNHRNASHVLCDSPLNLKDRPLKSLSTDELGCAIYTSSQQTIVGAICGAVFALLALLLVVAYRYRSRFNTVFKDYKWNKQPMSNSKIQEYQKTFDDDFVIPSCHHPRPIPVTEL